MSKKKNKSKKRNLETPKLGVIQPINAADPFDSLTKTEGEGAKPEAKKDAKNESSGQAESPEVRADNRPASLAGFMKALSLKKPEEVKREVKEDVEALESEVEEIIPEPAKEPVEELTETLATEEVEIAAETESETSLEAETVLATEAEVEPEVVVEPEPEPEMEPEPEAELTPTSRPVKDDNVVIELKGLTRRYGYGDATSYALKDFDLTIRRGEFIMIMGPSGCGKTTLLNIIGLLDRATSGEYTLNGEDVASISRRRQARLRAKKIGFIFQNFNLISSLPIIENVALPLVYVGRSKTARLKAASDALKRFHLGQREYYYPGQLSGGQQQRAAIARAIVSDPEIILADEPTGNLDSRSSSIVMDELKQIHEEGNTIIMVTHNPNLTAYATRVINMLDGQIDTDIKTVADHNLPQPIEARRKKRRRRRRKFHGEREEEA